jgi:predicted RND superfamily exporter protein
LGSAIAINLGINVFLPNVSYITNTMVMALQLAVSLDFSLFLIHRYYEEREQGSDVTQAVRLASKHAFTSITGSALTTILGFLALVFMSFSIGRDIGIVLSKGVLLSYLSVLLFMPPLIALASPLLEKTRHRFLSLKLGVLTKGLYKMRYIIPIVFVMIAGFSYFGEKKALFKYGPQAVCDENNPITMENQKISRQYGPFQPVVILVKNGTILQEQTLAASLMENSHILAIESLITVTDPSIPREFLPDAVKTNFIGDNYTRFIIYTDIETENETMYQFSDYLNETVSETYDDYYLVGSAVSTAEIKTTVTEDSIIVSLFSVIAVAFIIILIFRSISIPILLVAVIETSIWINMSIVFFQGIEITYIGYLVILALQLGATIDYAVLLSSRYLEFRKEEKRQEAMKMALNKSGYSILISSAVLAIAGFSEGLFSEIQEIHDIGILIGRGAVLSAALVILVLPSILLLADKLIMKTTWIKIKGVPE